MYNTCLFWQPRIKIRRNKSAVKKIKRANQEVESSRVCALQKGYAGDGGCYFNPQCCGKSVDKIARGEEATNMKV